MGFVLDVCVDRLCACQFRSEPQSSDSRETTMAHDALGPRYLQSPHLRSAFIRLRKVKTPFALTHPARKLIASSSHHQRGYVHRARIRRGTPALWTIVRAVWEAGRLPRRGVVLRGFQFWRRVRTNDVGAPRLPLLAVSRIAGICEWWYLFYDVL